MKTTKTKKLLSILLTIMLVVGMIPASVISAGATGTEPCESTADCTGYMKMVSVMCVMVIKSRNILKRVITK